MFINRFAFGLLIFGTLFVLVGAFTNFRAPTETLLSSLGLSALVVAAVPWRVGTEPPEGGQRP